MSRLHGAGCSSPAMGYSGGKKRDSMSIKKTNQQKNPIKQKQTKKTKQKNKQKTSRGDEFKTQGSCCCKKKTQIFF